MTDRDMTALDDALEPAKSLREKAEKMAIALEFARQELEFNHRAAVVAGTGERRLVTHALKLVCAALAAYREGK